MGKPRISTIYITSPVAAVYNSLDYKDALHRLHVVLYFHFLKLKWQIHSQLLVVLLWNSLPLLGQDSCSHVLLQYTLSCSGLERHPCSCLFPEQTTTLSYFHKYFFNYSNWVEWDPILKYCMNVKSICPLLYLHCTLTVLWGLQITEGDGSDRLFQPITMHTLHSLSHSHWEAI